MLVNNTILEFFFKPENIAFLVAGIIVLAILVFELLMALIGGSLHIISTETNLHFDVDKGDIGSAFDWLNPGDIPVIILLTIFLGLFSLTGFTLQWIWEGMGFKPLYWAFTAPIVTAVVMPGLRGCSEFLSKHLPRETTNAVTLDSLEGLYGVVTLGHVTPDIMGQARFKDEHGVSHYLTVVAESGEIQTGDDVVLLHRLLDSSAYFVVRKV